MIWMGGRGGTSGFTQGGNISFDLKTDKFRQSINLIKSLAREYETRLQRVTAGASKSAGNVDISGTTMRLSSNEAAVAIHEFAHTIATQDADKYGLTNHSQFWKEIKSIRRRYKKAVGDDTTRWISSYEHSSKKNDEFFAEAFTHAKLRELGMQSNRNYGSDYTYSQQVLSAVNKYFKKKRKR